MLAITLALALAVDRGIPNVLDSLAYHLERLARKLVAGIRASACRLRQRYSELETANRERLQHDIS